MNGTSQLARPISGEIDSDGRLLRADEALRKLHQRAGGDQGGVIAIPPLLALAQLSLKLQMKLSRAIRVADEAENLELWVDAEPKDNVVFLSITSCRSLPGNWVGRARDQSGEEASLFRFDASSRLIQATGIAAEGLSAHDFGKAAFVLLPQYFQQSENVTSLLNGINALAASAPKPLDRKFDGKQLLVSGMPVFNGHGSVSGYDCSLEYMPEALDDQASNVQPKAAGVLIGQHLAPALRQPLGRIIANAETIGSELQGPVRENYALYARDIANAARHLSALVDDIGDLEAVERPDFKVAPDKIELGDVARRVAGLLALKAADHSIRILVPSPEEKVPAIAEFRRVLQIMLNLVANAIRYSPDGTDIIIDIEGDDAHAVITVTDQGGGIAMENREKIFRKFERLGRSGDGGSGLGLYISRRLARAMGGELNVDDAAGGGAKFRLRLPAS